MNAAALGGTDGLGAAVDVLLRGTRQAADHGVAAALGDLVDGLEVAIGRERIAGLDDIDAHVVQHGGDVELLLEGHGRAGALLAVAQGGVEYDDAVLAGLGLGAHLDIPSVNCAASGRSGFSAVREPLSAQAQMPRRPSGANKKQKPAKKGQIQGRRESSRNRIETSSLRRRFLLSLTTAANHQSIPRKAHVRPKPLTDGCRRAPSGRSRRETRGPAMPKIGQKD